MSKKNLQQLVEECQTVQENINTLNTETTSLQNLIEQHKVCLLKLQTQRDQLEVSQQSAADLMISGALSTEDFSLNKKALSELYASIDETQSLLEIFERKLERDYPQKHSDLIQKLTRKQRILKITLAENLASDIAEKSAQQIKELMALLSGVKGINSTDINPLIDLGSWLIAAIFGGSPDNPKYPTSDENNRLVKSILSELGV